MESWIFQCPEKMYLDWVQQTETSGSGMLFRVSRYKKRIEPGDRVYLWISGKRAGIRARTRVAGEVGESKPDNVMVDESFDSGKAHPWVELEPLTFLEEPLSRQEAKEDPILASMMILRNAMGSIFSLTDEEAERLEELIEPRLPSGVVRDLWEHDGSASGAPDQGIPQLASGVRVYEGLFNVVREVLDRLNRYRAETFFRLEGVDNSLAGDSVTAAWIGSDAFDGRSRFFIAVDRDGGWKWGIRFPSGLEKSESMASEVRARIKEIWPLLEARVGDLRWSAGPEVPSVGFHNSGALVKWLQGPAPEVAIHDACAEELDPRRVAEDLAALTPVATLACSDGPVFLLPAQMNVFISYAREDLPFVQGLIDHVKAITLDSVVFNWDQDLTSTSDWTESIKEWRDGCDAAVVMLSNKSVDKERWMWEHEVEPLVDRRKEDGMPVVGVLTEEIDKSRMLLVEKAGIQMVDAERKGGKQPVFKYEARKWNIELLRHLQQGTQAPAATRAGRPS